MQRNSIAIIIIFLTPIVVFGQIPTQPAIQQLNSTLAAASTSYANVECHTKWTHYQPNGTITQLDSLTRIMSGKQCVTEREDKEVPRKSYVIGYNRRYLFNLGRNKQEWVLRDYSPPPDIYQDLQSTFAIPVTNLSYSDALRRSDTKIVRRSAVTWHGQPRVEWVVDVHIFANDPRVASRQWYGIFVDAGEPRLVHGVRTYDPKDKEHWTSETVLEYEASNDRWPGLKSLEDYSADKQHDYRPWLRSRHEVASFRRLAAPPPDSEFTLAKYGVPEPKSPPVHTFTGPSGGEPNYSFDPITPPSRYWLWLWVLLVVALGVAGYTFARYRRTRTAQGGVGPF